MLAERLLTNDAGDSQAADSEPPGKWKSGMVACLTGMKTESLNGKTVLLLGWKAASGRWHVRSEDDQMMDVLPERLKAIKERRPSIVDRMAGLFSTTSVPAAVDPAEAAAAAAARKEHDALTSALSKVWVRRGSIDQELTAQDVAREQEEIIPALARIKEESFMESTESLEQADFMSRLALAEQRDAQRVSPQGQRSQPEPVQSPAVIYT